MNRYKNILLALGRYDHRTHAGVARYAGGVGWHLNAQMVSETRIPHGWKGDGIISLLSANDELKDFVLSCNVPTVDLAEFYPDLDLPRVSGDNEAIGREAAEHLVSRGFRHCAYYAAADHVVSRQRFAGFRSTLAAKGVTATELIRPVQPTIREDNWAQGQQWLANALAELPKPLGVFCFNDYLSSDVLEACRDSELTVPQEVAIVGVDNNELICETQGITLSSVNHDLEKVGYLGAKMLDDILTGNAPEVQTLRVMPRGVTTRMSSDTFAVSSAELSKALGFIGRNLHRRLSIDEIVSSTTISRRMLERVFRQELDSGISEELQGARVRYAKRLLMETDKSMAEVAEASGFSYQSYFTQVFKASTGSNPRAFRMQYRNDG